MSEKDGNAAAGWTFAVLGDVGQWGSGGTPSRADEKAYGGNLPWLKIGDLLDGPVHSAEEAVTEHGLRSSAAKLLDPGTLLVAMYGSIGKLGITTMPCATNQAIASCKPHAGFNLHYLFYFLMSARHQLMNKGQGGTQLNISQTILKGQSIPIAPTNEQARIVSKIDELFSRIEEGERALKRVQKLVERYRQSVLKDAVTGELTREWRERNPAKSDRDAEAVLTLFDQARTRNRRSAKPVPMADIRDLPELPVTWAWAPLDALADVVGGVTVDKKRSTENCDEVPYLRVANVQRGYLDLSEVKTIAAPRDRITQLRLEPGDILFNEGGDIDKLGRGWLWEGQLPLCIHQNHVFRARLLVPSPWNKIVSWFGNVLGKSLFMEMGKQTTNLASLSLSKLKSFPVPVMSEAEAAAIVSRVEDAMSIIDKQLSELARQRLAVNSLRQAILKIAFAGQLVPQDPDDEPASALLARLVVRSAEASAASRGALRPRARTAPPARCRTASGRSRPPARPPTRRRPAARR